VRYALVIAGLLALGGCYAPELEEVVLDRRTRAPDVGAPDGGRVDAGEEPDAEPVLEPPDPNAPKCADDPCTFWALGTSGALYRVDPYGDRAIQSLPAENYMPEEPIEGPLGDVVVAGSMIYLLAGEDILEISLTQGHVARRFESPGGRAAPRRLSGGHGAVYVQTAEGHVVALDTEGDALAYGEVRFTGTPTDARDFAVSASDDMAWFVTTPEVHEDARHGDTLVAADGDGNVWDLGTTSVLAITGLAITSGDHLWAVTTGGLVLHLDTKTGQTASRYLLLDHDGFASASSELPR
jgi:hypothetical protein